MERMKIHFCLRGWAYRRTDAARYMDGPRISQQNLLDVASTITDECRQGRFKIVGLDIMEFNMHFLGIKMPDGVKDSTLTLVKDFITAVTSQIRIRSQNKGHPLMDEPLNSRSEISSTLDLGKMIRMRYDLKFYRFKSQTLSKLKT